MQNREYFQVQTHESRLHTRTHKCFTKTELMKIKLTLLPFAVNGYTHFKTSVEHQQCISLRGGERAKE